MNSSRICPIHALKKEIIHKYTWFIHNFCSFMSIPAVKKDLRPIS